MASSSPLVYFSVGEPSGDVHAANLIKALRRECPGLRAVGYGGPKMQAAGCELHEDLTKLAVMWFLRVFWNIRTFLQLLARAEQFFATERPDAVVLVDYPGFNWLIAKRAKRLGIPVFYYSPPQVWAWARWRVKKMRERVDLALSGLPFEVRWLSERGCRVTYVGHPFFDEVRQYPFDEAFCAQQRAGQGPLVVLLPGSRNQELKHNLRWLLSAAERIHAARPDVRFAAACFRDSQAESVRQQADARGLPLEVFHGRTPELIAAAHSCIAVSGSVSLELLHHARPTVVVYWIDALAYFVQTFFRKAKYITLVNLLADEDPLAGRPRDAAPPDALLFPEYLTWQDRSADLARHVLGWLNDPAAHARRVGELEALRDRFGQSGAAVKAARLILASVAAPGPRETLRGPHLRTAGGVVRSP
ncbi:MAG: lipid-A-disaccharide synthase [Pirellulales bacterium]|nr:lipid-A-disaccharide synthase [Pirellulales bacterium]